MDLSLFDLPSACCSDCALFFCIGKEAECILSVYPKIKRFSTDKPDSPLTATEYDPISHGVGNIHHDIIGHHMPFVDPSDRLSSLRYHQCRLLLPLPSFPVKSGAELSTTTPKYAKGWRMDTSDR